MDQTKEKLNLPAGTKAVPVDIPEGLKEEIMDAMDRMREMKRAEGLSCLEERNPDRAIAVLASLSMGKSKSWIRKNLNVCFPTLARLISDYADVLDGWKEMARSHTGKGFVMVQHAKQRLAELLIERMEEDEEFATKVTPKDLRDLAVAESISLKDALTVRGEASQITETRRETSIEDVKRAQEEYLRSIQQAEEVKEKDEE